MSVVRVRQAAREDLIEHYLWLLDNAGELVAERFLKQVGEGFDSLAQHPLLGAPLMYSNPALSRIRKWSVPGFGRHLIFYEPEERGIDVVRVLHSASDWMTGLELES